MKIGYDKELLDRLRHMDELKHHGVDGMQWGVWNTETQGKYAANPDLLPKTLDLNELANSVIRGDYGNGEDRRKALAEAGYDYDQVQNRVNDIIYGRVDGSVPSGETVGGSSQSKTSPKAAVDTVGQNMSTGITNAFGNAIRKARSGVARERLANEVIRGDYDNGEERKKRLRDAGYDYDIVQNRVNDIIYGR